MLQKLFGFNSLAKIFWSDKLKVWHLGSRVSLRIHRSINAHTYPFPFFIDVAKPEVVHLQNVELLAHIFEDVLSFLLWLQ